jgi:rhomboid family GlyGly-CTERM serine protease
MQTTLALDSGRAANSFSNLRKILTPLRLELIFFATILALANLPLFGIGSGESLIFFPERFAAGEWWRLVTHPFIHVTWYHLLLDGTAFLTLYAELRHWSTRRRLAAVVAPAAGSLIAAMTSPHIASLGFCGLSGIAHGLMVLSAVEMIRRGELWEKRAGWVALCIVLGKALIEAATGKMLFDFLYFGLVGVPLTACHAGGVIGGLALALCAGANWRRVSKPISECASYPASL